MIRPSALLCLVSLATLPARAQSWRQANPAVTPAPAAFARMAYDSARGACVLFGGWDAPLGSTVFRDTWEFDGINWTLRAPLTTPGERCEHAMCFDSLRGRTIMFGGQDFNFVLLDETWEWDGIDWTLVRPGLRPSARQRPAMVFDSARGVCVLFGGADAGLRNDTWEYGGAGWRQVATANAPSPRLSHAMVYDPMRARTVLFGGADGVRRDDTWEYDGADWTQAAPVGERPVARAEHGMAFDVTRGVTVLYGGEDGRVGLSDTWEYDGRRWVELRPVSLPNGNSAMAIAYDTARARTVVFGGYSNAAALPGTWEYGGAAPVWFTFGRGCGDSAGRQARLNPRTAPAVGGALALDIGPLPAGSALALVFVGLSDATWNGAPLPLDLAGVGLPGCAAYVSPDVTVAVAVAGGQAQFGAQVPNNAALAGLDVHVQTLGFDPAVARPFPGALSHAGRATVR